jgi:proline iminopeptidase
MTNTLTIKLFGISILTLLYSSSSYCQTASKKHNTGYDVFDELQQNVWYLPTTDKQCKLYVTSLGEGQPVVVLHGGPGNDFNYLVKPVRSSLSKYKFIFFDQRGSVLSPVADSLVNKLSVNILVEDLETLRQSLGLEKMFLFGHSFGTMLAIAYYIKYPQHVSGMILAGTVPPYTSSTFTLTDFSKELSGRQKALRNRPEIKETVTASGYDDSSGKVLNAFEKSMRFKITGLASFNLYHIDKWQQFQGGGVYYNFRVAAAIGNTMPETYDLRPAFDKYPVPVTIIQGDQDYMDPAAGHWAELIKKYPLIRLSVIKDASHYSWIDDPEGFRKYFQSALSGQ